MTAAMLRRPYRVNEDGKGRLWVRPLIRVFRWHVRIVREADLGHRRTQTSVIEDSAHLQRTAGSEDGEALELATLRGLDAAVERGHQFDASRTWRRSADTPHGRTLA